MKKGLIAIIILIFSEVGAYYTWELYNYVTDWRFLVAFIGGALTMLISRSVVNIYREN